MDIKKIWISPDTGRKIPYALTVIGGIIGIVVLALALIGGGTVLYFTMPSLQEAFSLEELSLALCLIVTALTVTLAICLGRRSALDACLFFLTSDGRLFVLDVRSLVPQGSGLIDAVISTVRVQKLLRRLEKTSCLPDGADEILKVEKIRENEACYTLICQVRRSGGHTAGKTYLFGKGGEDEGMLLNQLECREAGWRE